MFPTRALSIVRCLTTLAAVAAAACSAMAVPITFQAFGKVDRIESNNGAEADSPVAFGTDVSVTWTFESTSPDLSPVSSTTGRYAAVTWWQIQIGSTVANGTAGEIAIADRVSPPIGSYYLPFVTTPFSINGWITEDHPLAVSIFGSRGSPIFGSDALPLSPPDLGLFIAQPLSLNVTFEAKGPQFTYYAIGASFTSLEQIDNPVAPVPETGGAAVVVLSFAFLALARRYLVKGDKV